MVYTLTGKNDFTLQEALRGVIAQFLNKHGDFALERFSADETDVDTILQAVQSTPFLAEKKLIIVANISSNSQLVVRVDELLDRTLESNDVYIVDQKLDKRTTLYKTLKKETELTEFNEIEPHELSGWVVEQTRLLGGSISSHDAKVLVDRVGANQLLLYQEIKKLVLYSSEITLEAIRILTDASIQSNIFELLDAAFSGDTKRAVSLYREQRAAKIDPVYIVAMLTWQLNNLTLAMYADPPNEATLKNAGLAPFTAKKSLQLARHLDKRTLKRMIVELSELDHKLKSSAVDADAALELYLLQIISS